MLFRWCIAILVLYCGNSLALAKPKYAVSLDDKQGLIHVSACFEDVRPTYLTSGHRSTGRYIVKSQSSDIRMSRNNRRMYLEADCIEYTVDLESAKSNRHVRESNGHWLVNNRAWFWRPLEQMEIELQFFNAGKPYNQVSVPWPKSGSVYIAGTTPVGWTSRMLFGDISTYSLSAGGKQIRIAQTNNIPILKRQELNQWLVETTDAVASLYGTFPVDQAQIIVVPIGKRREAVPWAEVQRAGLPSVHLFIDQSRPIMEFANDWTGIHELSHLLLPRVDYNDRWISEGLASYYQNVAKARSGVLTQHQAWQKLRYGFSRGRAVMNGNLREGKSTRHLYWGGAAIFMLADARLRSLATPQTLDQVLAKLYRCCLPSNEMWSAEEIMQKLDELSQTGIFSDLLKNEAMAQGFPISIQDQNNAQSEIGRQLDGIFSRATDD